MTFLIPPSKFITNNNHYISQFFQKMYGFDYNNNRGCRPIIYNTINDSWKYVKNNKWQTESLFCDNRIYSKEVEDYFTSIETKASHVIKTINVNFLRKKILTRLLSFHPDLFSFEKSILYSFEKLALKKPEIDSLSQFYISIIQRFIINNTIYNDNYDNVIDDFKNNIYLEFNNSLKNMDKTIIKLFNDLEIELNNKKLTSRNFIEEWLRCSQVMQKTSSLLKNTLSSYTKVFFDLPFLPLGEYCFSGQSVNTSLYIPHILPVNCDTLLIHSSYNKNDPLFLINLQKYLQNNFDNSEIMIFSCPEALALSKKIINTNQFQLNYIYR